MAIVLSGLSTSESLIFVLGGFPTEKKFRDDRISFSALDMDDFTCAFIESLSWDLYSSVRC